MIWGTPVLANLGSMAAATDGGDVLVRLKFSDFRPTFRGRPVSAPPLRGEDCVQLGVMLSRYESNGGVQASVEAGRFQLRLRSLEGFK